MVGNGSSEVMNKSPDGKLKVIEALKDKPSYFENVVLDNLMTINLELGAALWVIKDRLRVVEELLQEKGIVTLDMIENYKATPEREQKMRTERNAFIEKIYGIIKKNSG
jgi:hypothetical protein